MSAYLDKLKTLFENNANEIIGLQMRDYMKGQFAFHGLQAPLRRRLQKEFLSEKGLPEKVALSGITIQLWQLPQREYQLFAIDLIEKVIKRLSPDFLENIEELIITKSWWDTVDMLAGKLAGRILLQHPTYIPKYPDRWIDSENMWLRRSALLFQLKYKQETDWNKLESYILKTNEEREFFIEKAIGWILREYSKTTPEVVLQFVDRTPLRPLSRREALKWINKHK